MNIYKRRSNIKMSRISKQNSCEMFAESVRCQLGVAKGNRKVVPCTRTGSTANDLSPKVLLQRCMTQMDRFADLSVRLPDSATNWQSSVSYASAWPDSDRNASVASLYQTR